MATNDGAGAGEEASQAGSGAPAGGSPEGGSENDDKPITAKQLKAALESQARNYEGRLAGQRAEFEAFKAGASRPAQAQEKPKLHSKQDLKVAVDAGQITQEQADDIWDRQREVQITEKAEAKALDAVTAKQAKERIDGDLARYKRLAPEILDTGSDERQKIVAEFQELTSSGLPNNLATELAAIRSVMGPLDKLEKARSASRQVDHDPQGGGNEERPKGGASKTFADQLNQRTRDYYQKQIEAKRYPDWKAVEAELKFATPKRRQEMGLRS